MLVGHAGQSLDQADLGANLIIHGAKLTECQAFAAVRTRKRYPSWCDCADGCRLSIRAGYDRYREGPVGGNDTQ